jgi:chitin synthase
LLLFRGESGSGKSEAVKLITRQYMNMGTLATAESVANARSRKKVLKSGLLLEAFGCCQSYLNPNASRFGKFLELQFDASGTFLGSQISDYLLEKTRVTSMPKGERNFHIFYGLLAGVSDEEKKSWRLPDAKNSYNAFKYLGNSQIDPDDASYFKDIKKAMKTFGLNSKYQKQIFQTLVMILHCGNVDFLDGKNKDQDSAIIVNRDLVEFLSS